MCRGLAAQIDEGSMEGKGGRSKYHHHHQQQQQQQQKKQKNLDTFTNLL